MRRLDATWALRSCKYLSMRGCRRAGEPNYEGVACLILAQASVRLSEARPGFGPPGDTRALAGRHGLAAPGPSPIRGPGSRVSGCGHASTWSGPGPHASIDFRPDGDVRLFDVTSGKTGPGSDMEGGLNVSTAARTVTGDPEPEDEP